MKSINLLQLKNVTSTVSFIDYGSNVVNAITVGERHPEVSIVSLKKNGDLSKVARGHLKTGYAYVKGGVVCKVFENGICEECAGFATTDYLSVYRQAFEEEAVELIDTPLGEVLKGTTKDVQLYAEPTEDTIKKVMVVVLGFVSAGDTIEEIAPTAIGGDKCVVIRITKHTEFENTHRHVIVCSAGVLYGGIITSAIEAVKGDSEPMANSDEKVQQLYTIGKHQFTYLGDVAYDQLRTLAENPELRIEVCLKGSVEIADLGKIHKIDSWKPTDYDDPNGVVVLKNTFRREIPLKPSPVELLLRRMSTLQHHQQVEVIKVLGVIWNKLVLKASPVVDGRCDLYLTIEDEARGRSHHQHWLCVDFILGWLGRINVDARLIHIHLESANDLNWWLKHSKKEIVKINVTASCNGGYINACDKPTDVWGTTPGNRFY